MKTLYKSLLALSVGSLMAVSAQAATYGNSMVTQPYLGAKIGQYDADGFKDKAFSYGIYGGAKFTPNFGVEAEYLTTNEETADDGRLIKSEYEGEVYGLYGTYSYIFPNTGGLYAKGRLGFAKNKIEVEGKDLGQKFKYSVDDTGIAGGLGLGYNIAPNFDVEVAYDWYRTIKDKDIDDTDVSGITLGAKFRF